MINPDKLLKLLTNQAVYDKANLLEDILTSGQNYVPAVHNSYRKTFTVKQEKQNRRLPKNELIPF